MMIVFNYTFIPFCINKTSEFSDYERKSDKHMSNMKWYYFFLLINSLIIPITGINSIKEVAQSAVDQSKDFNSIISDKLSLCSNFFINYIASQTFLGQSMQILDIGHTMYFLVVKLWMNGHFTCKTMTKEQQMERTLSAWKDDWYFDIGSNIACDGIIYLTVLLFS